MIRHFFVLLFLLMGLSLPVQAAPRSTIEFKDFLVQYQKKSASMMTAEQTLARAENFKNANSDYWQSRFEARPELGFLERKFETGTNPDISNRTQNLTGTYTQTMPSGTSLQLNGQKFLEIQNPLFSSIDRSMSATITQDLVRNAFGKTQRARANKAKTDFDVAQMEYRQSSVNSCEEAFNLYTDTYIQQKIVDLLKTQLKDARKARSVARQNFNDRLINKIDKLSSESDFIRVELQTEQAALLLENNKRQILAFAPHSESFQFQLNDPSKYLSSLSDNKKQQTLNELIADSRLTSQEFDVERSRSDRWTDVQLGLELGERVGRRFSGTGFDKFNEDYLTATVTFGFDLINKTEDADLKNAIQQKNALEVQKATTRKTQKSIVDNLYASNTLLKQQVKNSEIQVKLLKEKMDIAFIQMKRAKLDFENYLLHRNAFIQQKINFLNLKKDLMLNQFAIQKEFAHIHPQFCEVNS